MHIVTFNVCGIKNLLNFKPWNEHRSLGKTFSDLGVDIICLQETKLQTCDYTKDLGLVPGYQSFYTFSNSRKGYSGVAVYVKDTIAVLKAEEGLSGWVPDLSRDRVPYRNSNNGVGDYPELTEAEGLEIDSEGRSLVLDFGSFVLIGLYCPANSQGDKEEFRDNFFRVLDARVRALLKANRRVIVIGDINVAREIYDSAYGLQDAKKEQKHVPDIEDDWKVSTLPREIVNNWLTELHFVDTTRACHPDRRKLYTCWDIRVDGRGANFGTRIDLILTSPGINCLGSDVMLDIYGSDHCPVYADLDVAPETVPAGYRPPLLSRRRNAVFATLQSFWSPKPKEPSACPKPATADSQTSTLDTITKAVDTTTKAVSNPVRPSKITKKPPQKRVTSFFQQPARPREVTDNASPVETVQVPKTVQLAGRVSSDTGQPNKKEAANAWKKLFTVEAPRCHHNEDCKLLKSKKPGMNKGRSFWCCKRPKGEDGNLEHRCDYFKWA